jgi:DNA modification methylase
LGDEYFGATCGKCGATRLDSQLGLEPTPEAFVEAMVAVFREVRRVLRKDGTVWLNIGDSYANTEPRKAFGDQSSRGPGTLDGDVIQRDWSAWQLAPKQLVMMPFRLASALQRDGWFVRSDIVWAKPNPMPESVTDRPTKAHEYVFLLSKSPRYYYDADAVREPHGVGTKHGDAFVKQVERYRERHGDARPSHFDSPEDGVARLGSTTADRYLNPAGRNLRSVWTIATEPYPGAHFATFPRALVEPCIKAGCPPNGVVLDPFAGSGTTGLVAQSLSRRAVLIDLSAEYLTQLMDRNKQKPLGLGA